MTEYMRRHPIGLAVSVIVAVWTMATISYAVYRTFEDVTLINAAVVSALSAVLGIPSAAAGIAALGAVRRRKDP